MKRHLTYIFILFSIVCNGQQKPFHTYSIYDGLPISTVTDIFQDSRGILWLGTSGGGISYFDGNNFKNFDEHDGLSLPIVHYIWEDQGEIYCYAGNKVHKFIKNRFEVQEGYDFAQEYDNITVDHQGVPWLIKNSVGYLDNSELISLDIDNSDPYISSAHIFKENQLWYFRNDDLYIIDIIKKQVKSKVALGEYIKKAVIYNSDRIFCVSKNDKTFFLEDNMLVEIQLEISQGILSASYSDNQEIWLGMEKELVVYSTQNDSLTFKESIPVHGIKQMVLDKDGNVWASNRASLGLIKIANQPFVNYNNLAPINNGSNYSIVQDKMRKSYWIINGETGLQLIDPNKYFSPLLKTIRSKMGKIKNVATHDNKVAIVDKENLAIVNLKTEEIKYYKIDTLDIKPLNYTPSGDLLIGTLSKGLFILKSGESKIMRVLEENLVMHQLFSTDNNYYIGTNAGLYIYDFKNGVLSNKKDGLLNKYISGITRDSYGKIWVSTDQGVAYLKGGHFITITEENNLSDNIVFSIAADNQGNVFAGTAKGFDKISFNAKDEKYQVKNYSFHNGFEGIECNFDGLLCDEDNNILISSVGGVYKYIQGKESDAKSKSDIFITDVRLYYEAIDFEKSSKKSKLNFFKIPSSVTFYEDSNNLSIHFNSFSYNNQRKEYTYILEGYDEQWSPPSASKKVNYNNLPIGEYTFKVKEVGAANNDVAEISIYIQDSPAPFYYQNWFIALAIAFLVFIIILLINRRIKKDEEIKIMLEERVAQRTKELEAQDNEKSVLLQEVHHRVKNNLQIIISLFRLQTHFTENEEAKELFLNSQNRIRSMSKIHEKLYQSKELSTISVDSYFKELITEIINTYDTSLNVKTHLDIHPCNISIDELTPLALIVNEILSNSLKYAFSNVDQPEIRVSLKQNVIGKVTLIMSDNGPGFPVENWKQHESMGTELIKTLTEQLNGEVKYTLDKHPEFIITFRTEKQIDAL